MKEKRDSWREERDWLGLEEGAQIDKSESDSESWRTENGGLRKK